MSSSDIAMSVRGLSKSYTIARNAARHTTAGEALMHRLRHPFQKAERETFWALRDVDFDIQKGDVVGIIGRNGAGKSTLLKILSRITEPTAGEINLYGRVGSLLEVGTGFHQELTGRENIFLNGAILGMTRREIARQFDAIVDFAGVAQFLDTPVKRYSSGMYVRLAFAVAAHLNPEILIVDEVLAVGDAEFQKKCLGKMQDVAKSGRTVLFVSHNMGAVATMCNRAILLNRGQVQLEAVTAKIIELYQAEYMSSAADSTDLTGVSRKGTDDAHFTNISIKPTNKQGQPLPAAYCGCDMAIEVEIAALSNIASASVGVIINDANMYRLVDINSSSHDKFLSVGNGDVVTVKFLLKDLLLKPGLYSIELWLGRSGIEMTDWIEQAASFQVAEAPSTTETVKLYLAPYLCNFDVETSSACNLLGTKYSA